MHVLPHPGEHHLCRLRALRELFGRGEALHDLRDCRPEERPLHPPGAGADGPRPVASAAEAVPAGVPASWQFLDEMPKSGRFECYYQVCAPEDSHRRSELQLGADLTPESQAGRPAAAQGGRSAGRALLLPNSFSDPAGGRVAAPCGPAT